MISNISPLTFRLVQAGCIFLLLSSCHARNETKNDLETVIACMKRQNDRDDYTLVTHCEPLGPTKKFSGIWLIGLELSAFSSDQKETNIEKPDDLKKYSQIIAPVYVYKLLPPRNTDEEKRYNIEFFGRKSLLPPDYGKETLVIDKIISIKEVK